MALNNRNVSLTFPEAESPKSRCQQVLVPLEGYEGISVPCFFSWLLVVCWPSLTFLHLVDGLLAVCVSLSKLPLFRRTEVILQ